MKYKQWISEPGLKQIYEWAQAGMTNEQIIERMGIKRRAFYYWIERYPEFDNALREGRKPKEIDTGAPFNPDTMDTKSLIEYLCASGSYKRHPKTELEEEAKRLNIKLGHRKRLLTLKIKKLEKAGEHQEAQRLRRIRERMNHI